MKSNIVFNPWVGEKYGTNEMIFSKKTLILGGSHYDEGSKEDAEQVNESVTPGFSTEELVGYYFDPKPGKWKKTYSTFINSIYGRDTNRVEKESFFDSVVFHNYLQVTAGDNPYAADSYDYHGECHRKAFHEVLDAHKPEVVISWGLKVWNALPNDWGFGECTKNVGIKIGNETFMDYFEYPYQDGRILLVGAHHPSSSYASDFHHRIFQELGLLKD